MWAHALTAPETFERVLVPTPRPANLDDGQVLLRTLAGGICGSDLPIFRGRRSWLWQDDAGGARSVPGFPMHEVVGEVVASLHPDLAAGDRVVGWASGCDALAEFVVCSGDELAPFGAHLRPEVAILLQPLACVLYAVDQLGRVDGSTAAVIGLGPIGLLFTHVLKSRGAARVIGVDRADRSDVADAFGVDEYAHLSSDTWAGGLGDADRPDIVVEAVGHQVSTMTDVVTAAAPGGRVHYFGLPDDATYPFPMMTFLRKNLTLVSGVTRDRRRALIGAGSYLAAHRDLESTYVTDVFPMDHVQQAFATAAAPKRGQVKVAVTT
ncbi:zinc-binding dehydrogenase [Rhodococcus olei]|uniref:Zinc-binding dehydrogenase n=1 Tax=Rhodococcus olei TaxID=2161675 RepID=A0ABP8P7N6_9NOCA